jgi:arginine decarboxylase
MDRWTTRDSAELYNISGWSNGYFDINEVGNVVLTEGATRGRPVDLKRLVDDLVRRGLSLPLLIRFSDILSRRIEELHTAFRTQIDEYEYQGEYQLVMPIKVNQQRHVVEEVLEFGGPFRVGLEAGSKPELLVAIAMMGGRDGVIVCNGYKDPAYLETALLAQRLGVKTLIIADRFDEIQAVVDISKRLEIAPHIGVRAKISTKGSGKWAESGGERSKFGLTAGEMVRVVKLLESEGMLDRLRCLHFHIGSQITSIRAVKDALAEGTRIFIDLYKMGAPLEYFDIGGGLAVDYDGSKSNFHASKNYSLEEYAADVVYPLAAALNEANIPHPTIISESGRAMVAHQSVLVFDVLGATEEITQMPPKLAEGEEHQLIEELREVASTVSRKNFQEAYHDAVQLKEDAMSLYRHGILDLQDRAVVEQLFWATARRIWRVVRELDYVPEDVESLPRQLSDTYYCNFSLFQSLPDSWAVKALFPVMPLHRLTEQPTRRAILADLTCDSDGKMDQFIGLHDVKDTLELHRLDPEAPYVLGIFLVGAYQEILGDLHNLFGDVNAVHIAYDSDNGYRVKNVIEGDRVKDVLSYVSYDHRTMMERLRGAIETALNRGTISFEQSASLLKHYEAGLDGYTYLERQELMEQLLNSIVPRPRLKVADQA